MTTWTELKEPSSCTPTRLMLVQSLALTSVSLL